MTKTVTVKGKAVSVDSIRILEKLYAIKGVTLIVNIVIK